jgi:hypothetical protein
VLLLHQAGKGTLKVLSEKQVSSACVNKRSPCTRFKTLSMLEEPVTNNSTQKFHLCSCSVNYVRSLSILSIIGLDTYESRKLQE